MLNIEQWFSNFKVDSEENSLRIFILGAITSARGECVCRACNLK